MGLRPRLALILPYLIVLTSLACMVMAVHLAWTTTALTRLPAPEHQLEGPPPELDLNYIRSHGLAWGNGSYVLIEFWDAFCPFCRIADLELKDRVLHEVYAGRLTFIAVDLIVHDDAAPVHALLHCLYRERPEEALRGFFALYEHQQEVASSLEYAAKLLKVGECDVPKISEDLRDRSREVSDYVYRLAARRGYQGVGTPTWILVYPNGTWKIWVGWGLGMERELLPWLWT